MSLPDCKICGGRRFNDQHDIPSCEACEPIFAVHLISMRTDGGDAVAVCPCGWSFRDAWTRDGRSGREAAVIEHLRSVRLGGTTLFRCIGCKSLWRRSELLGTNTGHAPDNHIADAPMSCPTCDGLLQGEWHESESQADAEPIVPAEDDFP